MGGRCGGFENYVVGKDMTANYVVDLEINKTLMVQSIGVYPTSYQGS